MGDDDVICLSSDDETVSAAQSSVKKFKTADKPVKSDLEPLVHQPVNLKRKVCVFNESRLGQIKKPRVCSNGLGQNLVNSSSSKSVNGLSKSSPNAEKVKSRHPASTDKSTVHENADFRNSGASEQKSNPRVLQNEPNRSKNNNNVAKSPNKTQPTDRNPQSFSSLSKQSSNSQTQLNAGNKNEPSRSRASRTSEDERNAKKTSGHSADKLGFPKEKAKSPIVERMKEGFSDLPNINITPIGNPPKVPVTKRQEKNSSVTAELPESNRRSSSDAKLAEQQINNTPKSDRTNVSVIRSEEKFESSVVEKSREVDDNRRIPETSSSPEIEIVEIPELTKNGGADRTSNSKVSGKPEKSRLSMGSSKKTNGNNGQNPAVQSSRRPTIASTLRDENKVGKNTEDFSSLEKDASGRLCGLNDPEVKSSKMDEKSDKDSSQNKSTPKVFKISLVNNTNHIRRRITPKRITSTELNEPQVSESNSKDCDVKNGESSKSSKPENERITSEPLEAVAGCSKTPDTVIFSEPKKKKHKSMSETSFMTTPWKPQESKESKEKPEISQQQESPAKPQLVVKTKEPASVEQDTFAMFLSLCLQVERSPEMEKIVAKLKRSYDQLDPAYSRSRMFSDFLNKIREKILAKGRIYFYIGQVADEMKFRRKRAEPSTTKDKKGSTNMGETKETDGKDESSKEASDADNDRQESRRLRHKIKTIEMAMKNCAKRIQQLEVAEVDLDDDNNSNYIKLERYKSKMVELYTKLCEYTDESPDAGRSYLRPKHLRVTQIPSIDLAINSFINSKLSYNRKKATRGKSFVDGLIFPDYHDILECVDKVNDEQNLGLDKRRRQQLAKEAFTELGKHLQEARQRDYWDTFSENLENGDDPAAADPNLAEKLIQNQKIAEKNTAEIFEEYVRKQEQKNAGEQESTDNESEHEDDDDDDDEDEEEGKGASNGNVSDAELPDDEDVESSCENEKEKNSTRVPEKKLDAEKECESLNEVINSEPLAMEENDVLESSEKTIEQSEKAPNRTEETLVDDRPMEIEVNHAEDHSEEVIAILEERPEVQGPQEKVDKDSVDGVADAKKKQEEEKSVRNEGQTVEASAEKINDTTNFPDEAKDPSSEANENDRTKAPEIEVNHEEPDTKEEVIEPVIDQPRILRIRSFAKPPSSWASSQQSNPEDPDGAPVSETSINTETIDLLDDEPENIPVSAPKVPESSKVFNEVRPCSITAVNADSPRQEKLFVKVSRKLGEPSLSVRQNRPTIFIRSPNKSSLNQVPKVMKSAPNRELSVQKKIEIAPNFQTSLGNRQPFPIRLIQDPSVQRHTAIAPNPMPRPGTSQSSQNQQSSSLQKKMVIAPVSKTCVRNGQLSQNRPQQASVRKHIAVASNSKTSPGKSRLPQVHPQQNSSLQKQIVVVQNRLQHSSLVQKRPATASSSPRKSQLYQNRPHQNVSAQKQVAIPRISKTSPMKSPVYQTRLHRNPSVQKLVASATASKGGAGTSQLSQIRPHQNSSVQKNIAISRPPKTSSAKGQLSQSRLNLNSSVQKLMALAADSRAGGGNSESLNVSRQTTITKLTVTERVRTQNVTQNMPLQEQLINLANRRVFSLDTPQSIEVKVPKKMQSVPPGQLKAVKPTNNYDQPRINSNNLAKGNNNDNLSKANNNNNNNNNHSTNINNLPKANRVQVSSTLQPVSLATTTNPIRPGLQPVQQRQLQPKPSNSQPLVRLRVAPNAQILHSVQQQLINVSKAAIRPLGVSSIQAQGITLRNPRLIQLPERPTMAAAGARSAAYPGTQNPLPKIPRLSSSADSIRVAQSASRQPIQRTNYVLKPHMSNNTPPNYQQQHNHKRPGQKYSRTPPHKEPPKK